MRNETCIEYRTDPKLWILIGNTMYGKGWRFRTHHLHARRTLWEIYKQTRVPKSSSPRIFWDL